MVYNSLRRFFSFAELWLNIHYDSCFAALLKGLSNALFERSRRLSIVLIEGTVNRDRTTTLFMGNAQKAHQFAYCIYSKITKISTLGTTLSCHASLADLPHTDLTAIDARNNDIKKFIGLGYWVLPNISFTLDLHQPVDRIRRSMSRRRRRDIRRVSSQDYEYVISRHRVRDFDFFYWKMYLPYAEKRFGKAAMLSSYNLLKRYYKGDGGIVFVTKHKKPCAGILFQIKRDTVYALIYGIHDGNAGFVKNLAGIAALHRLINWARDKGIRWLDYGRAVPFFNDGIFRYKKEWGMTIEPHREQPYCVLKPNPRSKKAISLLQKIPFIIYENGALKGCIIHECRPRKEELKNACAQYSLSGIDSLTLVFYDHDTYKRKIHAISN